MYMRVPCATRTLVLSRCRDAPLLVLLKAPLPAHAVSPACHVFYVSVGLGVLSAPARSCATLYRHVWAMSDAEDE